MRRRQILTATAIGIGGLAGCAGGSNSGDSNGGESSSAKTTVQTFYTTLYGDDDLEATNEMYHPDSEAPELKPADFEPFGGLESIGATVASTEIVEQSDGTAEVHADVQYSTPLGSATNTDWFVLSKADGEWRVALWLPSSARGNLSDEEISDAMETAKSI
ncbi:hypothetical protein EGH24_02000 [Halonotius terrestris]|uniref:DUF4878 domain-containing protein n=1 Tax=Halonotius terrestris TaxID=2487750 RepID=A0A8J8TCJ4_9EURY|nr:hypothetical protein [Halonotius terrestris]TQQ83588.1 hypothetical protein EGH24_02000 [Halonotius terrestris]